MFKTIINTILDLFFPRYCLVCGEADPDYVCRACCFELPRKDFQVCIACKKPSLGGTTHPKCATSHGADGLVVIFDYNSQSMKTLLSKAKYHFLPGVFRKLGAASGTLLADELPFISRFDAVCPVPLHQSRLNWRGFNQSSVVAQSLASELGIRFVDPLVRVKKTSVQKDLDLLARQHNVSGAFRLRSSFKADVAGKNILLIDDVTTTGHTFLEAVKVLKRNKAKSVWCIALARE